MHNIMYIYSCIINIIIIIMSFHIIIIYVQINIPMQLNVHTIHLTTQQNTLCQRNRIACIQCYVVQKYQVSGIYGIYGIYMVYMAIQSHTRVGLQSILTLASTSRLTADTSPESAAWKRAFSSCTTCITITQIM